MAEKSLSKNTYPGGATNICLTSLPSGVLPLGTCCRFGETLAKRSEDGLCRYVVRTRPSRSTGIPPFTCALLSRLSCNKGNTAPSQNACALDDTVLIWTAGVHGGLYASCREYCLFVFPETDELGLHTNDYHTCDIHIDPVVLYHLPIAKLHGGLVGYQIVSFHKTRHSHC